MKKKQSKKKKKISEVKTFPAPLALGEIKKNINLNTNTPLKPSKEQIINQAIHFHLKGKIQEAVKLYQYFITQGFQDYRVFSNYGIILKSLGKLKEAELCSKKIMSLRSWSIAGSHSFNYWS